MAGRRGGHTPGTAKSIRSKAQAPASRRRAGATATLLAVAGLLVVAALGPSPAAAETDHPFLEYDQPKNLNGFFGSGGQFGNLVRTPVTHTRVGGTGGALRVDYDLNTSDFAFYQESLWLLSRDHLDLDDFYGELAHPSVGLDRLDLWVRGSGASGNVHSVKVEFKDESERSVHRYIEIPDAATGWTELSLPLDLTNPTTWNGATATIQRDRLKQLAFVVEKHRNPHASGSFFLDEVAFVDEHANPLGSAPSDDAVLERISLRAFQYFLDWYDPSTGLWQDRSEFADLFSVATGGFGLSALAIGEARGWIDRDLAITRVRQTLAKLRDGQLAGSTPAESKQQNGYRGFYYHFLNQDGKRAGTSELSPIDTALLLMGVLHVREHFAADQEIVALADALYGRVEWPWMLDPAKPGLFHLAWSPDCGGDYTVARDPEGGCFSRFHWDYTTDEVILLDLLAMGSPSHPVPADAFYAWQRVVGNYGGHELVQSFSGSLFTHFFADGWIDFSRLGRDGHPDPAKRVDWQQNAIAAARANRQFVLDQAGPSYPAYGATSWGLTASEAPGPRPACGGAYCAYGAPPAGTTPFHDGTIQPYGAAGVVTLVPDIAVPALRHYYLDTDLWRERFGLGDAYNLDPAAGIGAGHSEPWHNRVLFGIDQGPLLLGIDNHRGGSTRQEVMRNPYIQRALCGPFGAARLCDTTPPETTLEGPTGLTGDPTPTFSFSSSEPGSTFECGVDSGSFAACASPHTTSPLADGRHTFEVRAIDAAANADQTPASSSFTIDTLAPASTVISGPSDPTRDSTPTFTFSSSELGSTFECRVGPAPFAACGSPHTTPPLADGRYTFEVHATDQAGNSDPTPASFSFTVDTVAPVSTINAGPPDPTRDSTPTFTFSSNEPGSTFECRLDFGSFAACGSPHTTPPLADGRHTFEVHATDQAGNTDPTPARYAFTVDTFVELKVRARRTQTPLRQQGIISWARCPQEGCTVEARGVVRVPRAGRALRRFRLKPITKSLSPGERARLKWSLSKKLLRDIRRAFNRRGTRKRVKARVSVTGTDAAGNMDTEVRRIGLKR